MNLKNKIASSEKVTVLMPVYNAADFVKEAVESILSQTYRDFELLIIEDASTDNSLSILHSFTDERIKIVQNEKNYGITASLNKGIQMAEHALIARMDADDICHPWRLEKQVAYMLAHPDCAMLSTWVRIIDAEGNYLRTEGIHEKFIYYTLNFECCIMHSTVMFRKKFLRAIGGYRKDYSEDFDLFWRISRRFKIGGIDEPLVNYRLHENNTNTVFRKKEYDVANIENLLRNFKFYEGASSDIPLAFLECYRYNFDSVIEGNDLKKINNCIELLNKISTDILATENPNRNVDNIHYIWNFKRLYILTELSMRLPLIKMIRLLWKHQQKWLSIKISIKKMKKIFH